MAGVAVFPPNPLEKQVHRTELCYQKVKVNVQRLLQHLGPHHNQPVPLFWSRSFPQAFQQDPLLLCAIRHEKLGVEQNHLIFRHLFLKQVRNRLGFFYRVDNDTRAAALCQSFLQQLGKGVLPGGWQGDLALPGRKRHHTLLHSGSRRPGEQGIPPVGEKFAVHRFRSQIGRH